MFLKSCKIENFRKFGSNCAPLEFKEAKSYDHKFLDIAAKTSLIIGKNNSGKTTVIEALKKIINNEKISSYDFNIDYLSRLLHNYQDNISNLNHNCTVPSIIFTLIIGIDNDNKDLVTNILPFMMLEDVDKSEVHITIKYCPKEDEKFIMI